MVRMTLKITLDNPLIILDNPWITLKKWPARTELLDNSS